MQKMRTHNIYQRAKFRRCSSNRSQVIGQPPPQKKTHITYTILEMWANAQRDGRPAEYRWRPLFNAAKFGWRTLPDTVQ